jgi:ligand-binding sensor domain-containing protein
MHGTAPLKSLDDARKARACRIVTALLWALPAVFLAGAARAQTDPAQYVATAWRTEQGLPQNSVSAIAQDRDGYLWVATAGGLARFDGVRFTVFGTDAIPGLKSSLFRSLHGGSAGDLWIGSNSGVTRLHDGVFTTPGGSLVTSLHEDRAGKIWINRLSGVECCAGEALRSYASYRGTAVREFLLQARDGSMWFRSGSNVVRFDANGSMASVPGGVIAGEARDGSVWIAGPSQLLRYDHGAVSQVPLPTPSARNWVATQPSQAELGLAADPQQVVLAMAADTDGELLLLTQAGLVRPADGELGTPESLPVVPELDGVTKVLSFFVDREGNRWIGTLGRGLLRFRRAPLIAYAKENGLSDSPFNAVFEDREGRIWLGGDDSLYWFDGRRFHVLSDLPNITAIAQTPDGDLWFGGAGAVHR